MKPFLITAPNGSTVHLSRSTPTTSVCEGTSPRPDLAGTIAASGVPAYNAPMQRREFLTTVAAGVAAVPAALDAAQATQKVQRKGRVKQALFRNVFGMTTMSFDEQ